MSGQENRSGQRRREGPDFYMGKRNTIIGVGICLITIISVIAITYAYYIVGVSNANSQKVTLSTGTMSLTFADNDNGFGGAINFGDTITKKFTIQNTGTLDASAQMNWVNIINTYLDGSLKYTLEYSESLNGTYTPIISNKNVPKSNEKGIKTLVNGITVPATKTYYYNLKVTLVETGKDQTPDLNASFFTQFSLSNIVKTNSDNTLTALNLTSKAGIPDFNSSATTDETADGLYATNDNYGTSYYFRGAAENNYVKFGKWKSDWAVGYYSTTSSNTKYYNSLEECQNATSYNNNCTSWQGKDMYWRIIRINGDGSVRIAYNGTNTYDNGVKSVDKYIGTSAFNSKDGVANDNAYVGYMYGTVGSNTYEDTHKNINDSTLKEYLDKWYIDNFAGTTYESFISDEIFCNDRSIAEPNEYHTSLGYGKNATYYKQYDRNNASSGTPQLNCTQKNDAFTVNDTIYGNGALNYPIGTIIWDEIIFAGRKFGDRNNNYYLANGITDFWTMTPQRYSTSYPDNSAVIAHSMTNIIPSTTEYNVIPVINLSAETAKTLIGTGISTDPYRLPE